MKTDTVVAHKPLKELPKYKPAIVNPQSYLEEIRVDPDKIVQSLMDAKNTLDRIKEMNNKYHVVYNGVSGPCIADWDWIQEPPVSHGKGPIYAHNINN